MPLLAPTSDSYDVSAGALARARCLFAERFLRERGKAAIPSVVSSRNDLKGAASLR